MKLKTIIALFLFIGFYINSYSQLTSEENTLSEIRIEGFNNSEALNMLSQLTDN